MYRPLLLALALTLNAQTTHTMPVQDNTDEECQGMAVVAKFAAASRDGGRSMPDVAREVQDTIEATPSQHQQLMEIVVRAFSDYESWTPDEYAALVYRQCGTMNRNVT